MTNGDMGMMADPSAAERAYQRLKSDILSGSLATGPIDLRLLGDRLRMSVTPVREALARLSAERFVKLAPHQGYAVAYPSARRLESLYELAGDLADLAVKRCEPAAALPVDGRHAAGSRPYAEGMADLMKQLAAAQINLELGEHLAALTDRLFPARRCEPLLFANTADELRALSRLWRRRELSPLRARLRCHFAERKERVNAIARLLAEQNNDP